MNRSAFSEIKRASPLISSGRLVLGCGSLQQSLFGRASNRRFSDGCRSSPTGGGRGASHRRTRRRWRGSRCPRTPGTGRGPGCSGRTPGCTGWQPSYRREQCASAKQHPSNVRPSSHPQGHARGTARAKSPASTRGRHAPSARGTARAKNPASTRGRHTLGAWRALALRPGIHLETIFTACGSASTTTGAELGRSRKAGAACPPQAPPCAQQARPSPAPAHSPTLDAFFLTKSTI